MFLKRLKIKRLTKKLKHLQQARIHSQPRDEILLKEICYYYELAEIYQKQVGNKKYPFAAEVVTACLRAAASLDSTRAQYELGKQLLEQAKFKEELQQGLFASARNERQFQQLYEEAHGYLQAATKLGHIEAKRLYGLCYINGWGVPVDKEKGFELVVASIEQENSWEKVPQIFTALGLNKPEFFAAIMQRRRV